MFTIYAKKTNKIILYLESGLIIHTLDMMAKSYIVKEKLFGKGQVFTMLESRTGTEIFIPCRYSLRPLKVVDQEDVRQ